MDQVNLKKMAEHLGLSISTVSRALRDSYEIGTKTKLKVKALAEEWNYMPNPYASSLRKQRTGNIALVVPEVANNFFAQAINGIEAIAQEKGYHVLIYLTHDDLEKEMEIARHLMSGRVDGIIMSLSGEANNTHHIKSLKEKGLPVILFDRVSETLGCSTVTTDDYAAGFKATEHLIKAGCKQISYLFISKHLYTAQKRMQGYKDALAKHGLPLNEKLILHCSTDNEKNQEPILKMLNSKNRPDGIFASVERLAIATYHACNTLKLKIPEKVKVVSFSNLEIASLLNPGLSTLAQPAFDMGKQAATLLFRQLEKKSGSNIAEKIVLKSELIQRESTGR